eukprot:jgi/Botrbrau1/18192/Bobra.53_1s0055.1
MGREEGIGSASVMGGALKQGVEMKPTICLTVQAGGIKHAAFLPTTAGSRPVSDELPRPSYAEMARAAGQATATGGLPVPADDQDVSSPRATGGDVNLMPPTPNLSNERLSREAGSTPTPSCCSPLEELNGPLEHESTVTVDCLPPKMTKEEDVKAIAAAVNSILTVFQRIRGRPATSEEARAIACMGSVPSLEQRDELDMRGGCRKRGRAVVGMSGDLTLHWCGACHGWMHCYIEEDMSIVFRCACTDKGMEVPCSGLLITDPIDPSTKALCEMCSSDMKCTFEEARGLIYKCSGPSCDNWCECLDRRPDWTSSRSKTTPVESAASPDALYCEVCEVLTTSASQLVAHMDGKNHQRHASMAELVKEYQNGTHVASTDTSAEALHCEICDVDTPSATHKQFHLRGQRHLRKERQNQLLQNAELVSIISVAAVLTDDTNPQELNGEPETTSGRSAPNPDAEPQQATSVSLTPAEGSRLRESPSISALTPEDGSSGSSPAESQEVAAPSPAAGSPGDQGDSDAGVPTPEESLQDEGPVAERKVSPEGPTSGEGLPSAREAVLSEDSKDSPASAAEEPTTPTPSRKTVPRSAVPRLTIPNIAVRPGPISPFATESQQKRLEIESEADAEGPTYQADAHGDAVGALPRSRSGRVPRISGQPLTPHTPGVAEVKEEDDESAWADRKLFPSGGSISMASPFFCPVCGIIATSIANLNDHFEGRRHARRIQYMRNKPYSTSTLQKTSSGMRQNSIYNRLGSITLPSSMDFGKHLEEIQIYPRSPDCKTDDREKPSTSGSGPSRLSRTLTADDIASSAPKGEPAESSGSSSDSHSEGGSNRRHPVEDDSGHATKPEESDNLDEDGVPSRHICIICGITTTSAAHLEAHLMGRKHRRRVEVANGKGMKTSPHYCSLCDITTTSHEHLVMHVNGKMHKRRVATGNVPCLTVGTLGVNLKDFSTDGSAMVSGPQSAAEADAPAFSSSTRVPPTTTMEREGSSTDPEVPAPDSHRPRKPGAHHQSREAGSRSRPTSSHHTQAPYIAQDNTYVETGDPTHTMSAGALMNQMPMYVGGQAAYGTAVPIPSQAMYGFYPHPFYPQTPGAPPMWWHGGQYSQGDANYAGYMAMAPMMAAPGAPPAGLWRPPPAQQNPNAATYRCQCCNFTFYNLEEYRAHVRSKQHNRRISSQQSQRDTA